MTFRTESWRPFFIVLVIFDILQQKLSMISFSYALILVLRLRYTVEEHSGEILAPGSEYKWLWYDPEVMHNWVFPHFLDLITRKWLKIVSFWQQNTKQWVPVSQYSKFQTSACVQSVDMILRRLTFKLRGQTRNTKQNVQGSKFVVAMVANATMFSHLLPGCSCGSKHLLLQ